MELGLSGKTAVVTAASGGIGGAVVQTLIEEGARVLGADLAVSAELKDSGALTVETDLTTEEGLEGLKSAVEAEFDGVDLLVNGVGGLSDHPLGKLDEIDDEVWRKAFELNFFAPMRTTRVLQDRLREAVVNVSTSVARWPNTGPSFYGASKSALRNLSKGLADELGARGVRVNTVSPGLIRTPLWNEYGPRLRDSYGMDMDMEEFLDGLPLLAGVTAGRWGTPQEVANLIVFLGSPAAGYITGQDYLIDGGAEKVV